MAKLKAIGYKPTKDGDKQSLWGYKAEGKDGYYWVEVPSESVEAEVEAGRFEAPAKQPEQEAVKTRGRPKAE